MIAWLSWETDFDATIALLVVIITGLGGLAVAAVRSWKALRRELKTNHGSTTFGDSQDRQYEKLHDLVNLLTEVRSTIQAVKTDLSRLDTRVVDQHRDTMTRVARLENTLLPSRKDPS
ncbi:MAG: hypothetical protein LBV06_07215 [Propionibacteriaceae bacterium]|jgi:hypothetical protein|nr:hypothetical protein [Propionibacteriaceae bacterium]